MNKGTKYYSMDGRQTKRGIEESIKYLETEISEYENAKDVLDNLCITHIDRTVMFEVIDKYIASRRKKIEELRG